MNATEVAYCAGLFEGEGYIGHRRTSRSNGIEIQISMTDVEPLERFQEYIGGLRLIGNINGPYFKSANRKLRYELRIGNFEEVQHCIAAMWPYLSPRRREQARVAITGFVNASKSARWQRLPSRNVTLGRG